MLKKRIILGTGLPLALLLAFCTPKVAPSTSGNVTYENDIKPLISGSCAPCHTIGRAPKLNTMEAAKSHIDEILAAVNKNPGEEGFMPKNKEKLSADQIRIFERWKEQGLK